VLERSRLGHAREGIDNEVREWPYGCWSARLDVEVGNGSNARTRNGIDNEIRDWSYDRWGSSFDVEV